MGPFRSTPAPARRWVFFPLVALLAGPAAAGDDLALRCVVPARSEPLAIAAALAADAVPPGSGFELIEQDAAGPPVAAQIVPAPAGDGTPSQDRVQLLAVIPPRADAPPERRFHLAPRAGKPQAAFHFHQSGTTSLELSEGGSPVWAYQYGVVTREDVPASDPRRSRSCYLHPLYGLDGEVLTDDFPRDHYHHHGVFWTWPHVRIGDQEYDLWADRGIRQQFVRWLDRQTGPAAATLAVENAWLVGPEKVMTERVWLRTYRAVAGTRSLDLVFTWIPAGEPVTLWGAPGKSYGGLTVRFAPPSRNDPSTVITVPSGPTTADLPNTPLEWADFTSRFGDRTEPSGAAIFVPPDHPDFPPTWLTRHYGPLCVGWPGVRPKTFPPGKPVRLHYRIWIHQGPGETDAIGRAYEAYRAALHAALAGANGG